MPYSYRTDKIVTYDDWDAWAGKGFNYEQFIQRWWGRPLPERTLVASEQTAAYINEGRWIADCPTGCGGSMLVTPVDPNYFCTECGHGWFPIEFPSIRNRRYLEAVLMKRPLDGGVPKNRNWLPHETLDDLKAQNAARGIV
jgi:hypothetical protein